MGQLKNPHACKTDIIHQNTKRYRSTEEKIKIDELNTP